MGMSYTPMSMYGVHLINGQTEDVYAFLTKNGYSVTDAEIEKIDEDGIEVLGELAGFTADVVTENCWSGHGQAIGFHCDAATPEVIAMWTKEFPNVPGSFFTFVQVG